MPDILIPERLLRKMERVIDRLDKQEELINEDEAAKYLGIEKRSLQKLVYKNEIPSECYRTAVTNKRMYIKSKLILPILALLLMFASCSRGTCPGINKNFFYKTH